MASQSIPRKRPAPGTSPAPNYQPQQNTYSNVSNTLSNDQFLQWGQGAQDSASNAYGPSSYNVPQQTFATNQQTTSNQIARRPPMQQVVNRPANDWTPPNPINPFAQDHDAAWNDDIADLEAKAQIAKKDALNRRKAIPPFVQKLSSFLDDGRNTSLIRWSEDGNSFIVVDEDEFAKKLIPELFKHNNYASFVRQLNMYGFHKKVGLSDNSMRASEKKNKTPSEYSNPYFRRGHPDLLWLIQKPKNGPGQSTKGNRRKGGSEPPEEEEEFEDVATIQDRQGLPKRQLAIGQGSSTLSDEQNESIHRELQIIRQQQTSISRMMAQLKREHEQLYGQAVSFQDQHSRHENSINAILTFLATVYNRSLQGNEAANIASLFQNNLPNMPSETSQGNVVDVGDFAFDNMNDGVGQPARPFKRQPLLLQAPPPTGDSGRVTAVSPSSTASPAPRPTRRSSLRNGSTGHALSPQVEEVFEPNGTSNGQRVSTPLTRSQNEMLSMIQNSNARNLKPGTPAEDFSNVLSSLENSHGNAPLTNQQRNDMLRMMNNSSNQGGDNSLVSSNPPAMPANYDRRLSDAKASLDSLAKMQADQDRSVQNLTNLLQPLSPSGSIPGIGDGTTINAPPLDIDDFLNSHGDYFADFPSDNGEGYGTMNGNNINFQDLNQEEEMFPGISANDDRSSSPRYDLFGDGGGEDHDGGGRVESVNSSEVTTPQNRSDGEGGMTTRGKGRRASGTDGGNSPSKRRRRNG